MGAQPLTVNAACWAEPDGARPDSIIAAWAIPAAWRDQPGELFHWVPGALQRAASTWGAVAHRDEPVEDLGWHLFPPDRPLAEDLTGLRSTCLEVDGHALSGLAKQHRGVTFTATLVPAALTSPLHAALSTAPAPLLVGIAESATECTKILRLKTAQQ
ncbi:hypothetical protein SMC26_25500 [Actinomadura fulvescens]|uniref:Uncharacterized protein n=1 Tax=Actinomadura fulvescens TaxID=46160 RepID=A0ABN3Q3R0_9ACTN